MRAVGRLFGIAIRGNRVETEISADHLRQSVLPENPDDQGQVKKRTSELERLRQGIQEASGRLSELEMILSQRVANPTD